jgi:lipid A disaccharide synthetase
MSLVNLLADRELFPEYPSLGRVDEAVAGEVLGWLNDPAAYEARRAELAELCGRVAEPGACARTAQYILEALGHGGQIAGKRQAA